MSLIVPASAAAQHEWYQRIEAEYRSAALTAQFSHWLIQVGAAPDLIAWALRIVEDELAHAELSHSVYETAGGATPPTIEHSALELKREAGLRLDDALLRCGVELFCLGETVAVRLFHRMREGCTVEPARAALDRILKDEVQHRDFGWTLLEWLLMGPRAAERADLLRVQFPRMLEAVRRGYGGVALDDVGREHLATMAREFPAADRAWGLIPVLEYVEAFEQTLERDYRPRLRALGIEL